MMMMAAIDGPGGRKQVAFLDVLGGHELADDRDVVVDEGLLLPPWHESQKSGAPPS